MCERELKCEPHTTELTVSVAVSNAIAVVYLSKELSLLAIFISYAFLYCGDNQCKIRIIADGKTEKRETNKVSRRNDLNSMCSDSKHLGFLHFSTAATLFRLLPDGKRVKIVL